MYANLEQDYEKRILELETQKNLLRNRINQLSNENAQLRAQIQQLLSEANQNLNSLQPPPNLHLTPQSVPQTNTPYPPSPSLDQPSSPSGHYAIPTVPLGDASVTMKRQCPQCRAHGFAIKEVDDRTNIISYIPRRMYAKKRVCTKCMYEF